MLERGVIVVGLAAVVVVVALAVRVVAERRAAAATGRKLPQELHTLFPAGRSGIVYFYGPNCGTCARQAAILEGIARDDGISVVHVDATSERKLADAFGVMSVPATVIVDSAQNVVAVNPGLRSQDALRAQLE